MVSELFGYLVDCGEYAIVSPFPAVKVLLFNLRTGDYLQPSANWEPGRETALIFPTAENALAYAVERRFEGVVVHLYFGGTGGDIFLPVSLPKE